MLPTLERLFELEDQARDEVVGDLTEDFSVELVAGMADADNVDSIFHWIDTLIQNPNVEPIATYQWPHALHLWVRAGLLTREAAIEQLKRWILQRSSEFQDTFSGFCICELLDLNAIEEKQFVESCFDRGQIDEDLVDRESCTIMLAENPNDEIESETQSKIKFDPVEYLSGWHGFAKANDSLNPRSTELRDIDNGANRFGPPAPIDDAQLDTWFKAIRQSNDQHYPRDAVEQLCRKSSRIIERLIDEVRWGLSQAGGAQSRASNGPFIAASILAAQEYVPASDLFLDILDLPAEQRADVFGDAIEPSIVAALSSSLLGNCDPIDQRINDAGRGSLDRAGLAMFYPLSVWHGYVDRQQCIDQLLQLLDRYIDCEPLLPGAIYDALCLMSVPDDDPVVSHALELGICNQFISQQTARRCVDHPDQAGTAVWEIIREFRPATKAIEESIMFDRDAINPRPTPRNRPASELTQESASSLTVVNDSALHTPRNAACPCGSGKKYKKCCGKR
jgi:hypothetical protein